ncbi:MAG TPA: putative toxin-antitoxin system toxin component, PIN family [Pirellulales bacterium]|nr:putative toxin-antitoxin system toxin component, PIN family [Pirellulales bacterium]
MRVVLDTNLVVRAASKRGGLARELLLLAMNEPQTMLLSHSLYAETRKVMHYPRLRAVHELSDADIQLFLDHLVVGVEQVEVASAPITPIVGFDPTDDIVLLAAVAGHADAIGTNNRHFFTQDVQQFAQAHGVRIFRDTELIAELRGL